MKKYLSQSKKQLSNQINLKNFIPFELMTWKFYSILYYNSEIWQIPTQKPYLKNLVLSASAKALQLCSLHQSPMTSLLIFLLNTLVQLPSNFWFTNTSFFYTHYTPTLDWLAINFNQNCNTRETIRLVKTKSLIY